jgi:hypothetical protein
MLLLNDDCDNDKEATYSSSAQGHGISWLKHPASFIFI